jgi:hypothetical protein
MRALLLRTASGAERLFDGAPSGARQPEGPLPPRPRPLRTRRPTAEPGISVGNVLGQQERFGEGICAG